MALRTITLMNLLLLALMVIPSSSQLRTSTDAVTDKEDLQHVVYDAGHQFQACSFTSTIRFKDIEPKTGFEDEIFQYFADQKCPNISAPISQVSRCISSFELDRNNAIQHIQATLDVLKNYYVFKDIAIDPLRSFPLITPLGYPIYNRTDQGKFNIIAGFENLLQEVKSNDIATLDIFWKMNALGAKLFDGHMGINSGISTGGMLSNQTLVMFSGEVLDGSAKKVRLRTAFPTNEEFILVADILSRKLDMDSLFLISKRIIKIDGKDPLGFFIELASKPTGIADYKSIGARVNGLIRMFTAPETDNTHHGMTYLRFREMHPDTSKFLKDEYDILYEDSSSTSWKLVQFIPQPVSCNMTKKEIEKSLLSRPGKMYQHLDSMKRAVIQSDTIIQLQRNNDRQKVEEPKEKIEMMEATGRSSSATNITEDEPLRYVNFTQFSKSIGHKIYDDFAVLKINSFSEFNKEKLIKAWGNLTDEAHSKGVKKLIIDVIGNGGGVVKYGYLMAQLLYPSATWEDISNPYDHLHTPSLQDDVSNIQGIVDNYYDLLKNNLTAVEQISKTLNADPNLLIIKLDSILSLLGAMMDILSGEQFEYKPESTLYLEGSIVTTIEWTKTFREILVSAAPMRLEMKQIYKLLREYITLANDVFDFPFADLNFKKLFGMDIANTDVSERVVHIRGGILGNYTSVFHITDPNDFSSKDKFKEKYIKHPYQFEEYIILGSGNSCGSTTDTFRHTVQAYAHTQNKKSMVVPPVHTVSFGGTGKLEDAAVSQFPAGVSGSAGNVEELYLIGLTLRVLNTLLPPLENEESLKLIDKFHKGLPDACYYCNHEFSMPIYQIYSKLTGPESIPMEYINEIPDHYIRQWPMATSFSEDKNLPNLYKLTNRFFYL